MVPLVPAPASRSRSIAIAMALALGPWLASPPGAGAQMPAEESARKLKPAEGLEATLWAAEPLLVNPTNMDVDSRGRVWVSEGQNYRLTRGGNARFHRMDGADRIKILEDTDGDGRADKATVFADNIFPVPMGLAVEDHYDASGKYTGCRVFVGNSPNLLVLEDTDGDDRVDKRYPLLTGFGGVDSDHGVHGMVLGLDGKLYFTHGDGCCSVQSDRSERQQNFDVVDKSGRRVRTDQLANTLRVNRDGTEFEIICDRQRNNYEAALSSFGTIFVSDNDDDGNRGCRVIWTIDGGHYGYHTPGSPRHWGEDVPGTIPKLVGTGNGSPAGILVYEGPLLPKERGYEGAVLEVDAGSRQVNAFPIDRKGASYRTEYKVLLASDDPWFRPVDACVGPDGSVFVADWYDAGVGGHAFSDQTTGRIFRVAPKGHKAGKPAAPDFGTTAGRIAALKSPVVAARDAARRSLIAEGESGVAALEALYRDGDPMMRARALQVLAGMKGDAPALAALKDQDPRIRELAVRLLGRDCRENGVVSYDDPKAKRPPAALAHLDALLPMADDPDAGVRRELISAIRNLPTERVGEALRALAASWDGQDRWYLETLGLALDRREETFLARLLDGSLYGPMDVAKEGREGSVALPPYFPVDRNEAFLPAGSPDLPTTALSKALGLAWRLRRLESTRLVGSLLPALAAPELRQAADDVLGQVKDPRAAAALAELASRESAPARRGELVDILARKLEGGWNAGRDAEPVVALIGAELADAAGKPRGVRLAVASRDPRYGQALEGVALDPALPEPLRAAAVEGLATIKAPRAATLLDRLIGESKGRPNSDAIAEAAVRASARVYDATNRLRELIVARDYPLGVRREALRSLGQRDGGARAILDMAKSGSLPEDLKTEATTLLHTTPSIGRALREEAAAVLPMPKAAGGRPLPPVGFLLRREGDPGKGRIAFFRAGQNACAGCHRVRGQGQWVGPDLSTIGTKYGKDELLRSILNPSAAIGYNYRALILAMEDGRVLTGLPVEDTPDRLVIKTAEGRRIAVRPADVEARKTSDVSLMPEGLAQGLTADELVDLLAFLSALREPVSIVGQYHVLGPVAEEGAARAIDPTAKVDLDAIRKRPAAGDLAWRRVDANAEGLADLADLAADPARNAAYAFTAVTSPVEQKARLVVESGASLTAWLDGKTVLAEAPAAPSGGPREVELTLPRGTSTLLLRLAGPGGDGSGNGNGNGKSAGGEAAGTRAASLVTTFVSAQPVSFATTEAAPPR
ncbi:Cytochrome c [Aquisphaera giovannonii]|uniref:Cytochrome c n=1 Tax=Aquisphaera giovannonii TaxID=406548 RepID=A0A5B9VWN8_9BACT|nr:PVC-type heme-binding CxxCH protein [Aquisphaera giovannonii]QEH32357.1 Cytochrome c [Aquisphaera giovannonii]